MIFFRPAGLAVALLLLATGAASAAKRGFDAPNRLDHHGERIEQRLLRRGDRIEARFDHRAARQSAMGHENRFDRRAERVDGRVLARADRVDRRWDRWH